MYSIRYAASIGGLLAGIYHSFTIPIFIYYISLFTYYIHFFIYNRRRMRYNIHEVMIMEQFGKPGIMSRFEQLDDDLLSISTGDRRIEIVIVGGSALMMLGIVGNERMTTDIDVLEAEKQIDMLLERYDMNQHVSTFLYRMPENWYERRQRIPFSGMVLDVYAPSNEDLAIMKLDAYREVDIGDLHEMVANGELDLEKLQGIIQDDTELRINYDDEGEWETFLSRFDALKAFATSLEQPE